ncbi:MAG: N-acetylmuramoyl-L-alanine amidase [Bacteroidaceae bacterium]|nr:N-acetylmuramoyl-L-alanine amidase [Bacteroidaceae bacterium]
MKIFLDNGHGSDTPGKRSPDGTFLEYHYNRLLASQITSTLQSLNYDAELLVPEKIDIPLKERCHRVNTWCNAHGSTNAICISIHFNAHGNGSEWTQAKGWSIYTSKGNTKADLLAESIAQVATELLPDMRLRSDPADGDLDIEEDFYILKRTVCPCVLSENGFMTNSDECRWLMTNEAIAILSNVHVNGIINYLKMQK